MNICPNCGSRKAKKISYMGAECIICPVCGFSEADQLDVIAEPRTSQRAKGRFSPYKAGGGRRAVKK